MISTTPPIPTRSLAKRIFTFSKKPARSASIAFEKEAPLDAEVSREAVYFLTEKSKFKLPITPPPLRDHGNYVISLNRFVKWLGTKVEETGITIFTGFAGSDT